VAAAKEFEVSVESSAGLERKLKIRVPSADIEREIASRLAKVGKTAKLKGFRPGKIPEKVVRKYYGGQVRDEVLSDVIRSSYSQAIADQKLNPAGGPRIEAVPGETPADQEHFTYRATFEVYPEIALQPSSSSRARCAGRARRRRCRGDDREAARSATWRPVERRHRR
jgi:trigger factor